MTRKKDKDFVKKLKLAMLESGLNQTSLAKKLGLTHSAISAWLNGRTNPSLDALKSAAQAMGRPVNYFFDNSNTEINGNQNIVGKDIKTQDKNDLEKEIILIKKELEVHRYKLENLSLKLEKISKK